MLEVRLATNPAFACNDLNLAENHGGRSGSQSNHAESFKGSVDMSTLAVEASRPSNQILPSSEICSETF